MIISECISHTISIYMHVYICMWHTTSQAEPCMLNQPSSGICPEIKFYFTTACMLKPPSVDVLHYILQKVWILTIEQLLFKEWKF